MWRSCRTWIVWLGLVGLTALAGAGCEASDQVVEEEALTPQSFITQASSSVAFAVRSSNVVLEEDPQDPTLRHFAQEMLVDHQHAQRRLAAVARQEGLRMPQALLPRHEQMLTQLRDLEGQALAENYPQMIEQARQQMVQLFERAARELQDPELRQFASQILSQHRAAMEQHTYPSP